MASDRPRRTGNIPVRSTLNWTGDFRGSARRFRAGNYQPSQSLRRPKAALSRDGQAQHRCRRACCRHRFHGLDLHFSADSDVTLQGHRLQHHGRHPGGDRLPGHQGSGHRRQMCREGPGLQVRRGGLESGGYRAQRRGRHRRRRPDHCAPRGACGRSRCPFPESWTAAGFRTAQIARDVPGRQATRCDPRRWVLWFIHSIDYNGSIPLPR